MAPQRAAEKASHLDTVGTSEDAIAGAGMVVKPTCAHEKKIEFILELSSSSCERTD